MKAAVGLSALLCCFWLVGTFASASAQQIAALTTDKPTIEQPLPETGNVDKNTQPAGEVGVTTMSPATEEAVTMAAIEDPATLPAEQPEQASVQPPADPPAVIETSTAAVTQAAVTQASVTQAAATQAAVTQAAVTQAAVTQAAVTQATTTQTAVTQAAVTQAATTQAAVTQAAVTQAAVTQAAVTEAAVTEAAATTCLTVGDSPHESDCHLYRSCGPSATADVLELVQNSCPPKMAFSAEEQRCTRDISSCDDPFVCAMDGKFADTRSNTSYYLCLQRPGGFYKFHVECSSGKVFTPMLSKCFVDLTNLDDFWNIAMQSDGLPDDEDVVKLEIKRIKKEEKLRLKNLKLKQKMELKLQKELAKKAAKDAKKQAKAMKSLEE